MALDTLVRPDAIDVECPDCEAAPQHRCHTAQGLVVTDGHPARQARADAALACPVCSETDEDLVGSAEGVASGHLEVTYSRCTACGWTGDFR